MIRLFRTLVACATLVGARPIPDAHGALRAGVLEDFPNGGGNRAYLFTVDGPQARFSWFLQDSGSPVDLWIATGGRDMATLMLPVLKPKAYLPVHWHELFGPFKAGSSQPYDDPELAPLLAEQGVRRIVPAQYKDKWRLEPHGMRAVDNSAVKRKLGFN